MRRPSPAIIKRRRAMHQWILFMTESLAITMKQTGDRAKWRGRISAREYYSLNKTAKARSPSCDASAAVLCCANHWQRHLANVDKTGRRTSCLALFTGLHFRYRKQAGFNRPATGWCIRHADLHPALTDWFT